MNFVFQNSLVGFQHADSCKFSIGQNGGRRDILNGNTEKGFLVPVKSQMIGIKS